MGVGLPKVVDLFCGVGGLSLGAARAGFEVAGAIELDCKAYEAHISNFPTARHLKADISSLKAPLLFQELELEPHSIDGVIGGPPCQGFSRIGKQSPSDQRNQLFIHFFRLVSEISPRFFVVENVPGLLDEKYGFIVDEAVSQVLPDYTVLGPIAISAHDFGAPTTRTRVFYLGFKTDDSPRFTKKDFEPPATIRKVRVKTALRGLPQRIKPTWISEEQGWRRVEDPGGSYFGRRVKGIIPKGVGNPRALEKFKSAQLVSGCLGTRHGRRVRARYATVQPGEKDQVSKSVRLDLNHFCPTLRAGTGHDRGRFQAVRPLHPICNRVITPREAARLQGFPDWFQFSSEKWHSFRQIGSSVSPLLAEQILLVIRKRLWS